MAAKKTDKPDQGNRLVSDNRQARFNYELLEFYEAGLALTGTEVKAAKTGKVQLQDAFGMIEGNEAWLYNAHISHYTHGNYMNHEVVRKRKLLLHRQEIDKLLGRTREKGLSLIPTKMYLKNGLLKVELAVGRGKKLHDKRDAEKERTQKAEAREEIKRRSRI